MNDTAKPVDPDILNAVPARYWQPLEDGRIQCDVCPRECKLHDGQRGLCFVRARRGDELVLTTYGRASGYCIDPIEKKPLNHFLPGTPVLSFGTAGCNLTCKFCQNWDISKSRQMDRLMDQAAPGAIAAAAQQTGCRSVAYTYNDPVIFLEYAVDVAAACHEVGIANVAVTAGYIKDAARQEFFQRMDAVNLDLKGFTEDFYHKLCTASLAAVQETAVYLVKERKCWVELTTLLIPGENDSEAEIEALTQWVFEALGPDVPLHFTAFHPDYKMMDKPRTPPETLIRAWKIGRKNGLHHVYTGNIHHEPTGSTYCPGCGTKVIGRDWHQLSDWGLGQGGHCTGCGTAIAGRFEPRPGTWGRQRKPIRLTDFARNWQAQQEAQ
ncbi:MAG: AmmeMemoRadiSam system radical SAM enzyme [Rhodospirillales bacterium]|jgi:pyruvate formate lyase activating enzyme|uniref:AmmeMemoRadiSam system radical SAM enzyme n=1 Tax=Hwanghaeella sp. 1Z406 TaxID=3402811 RepID=UPI000C8E904F|nr:AmmeMemoRadiSam system radical SAM enzyme [Rhodospirillales bacterium]|tara:strand:+ start:36409 stop:37551 length:1143 start_codon:yes stop_codon:yes gene_type:complete